MAEKNTNTPATAQDPATPSSTAPVVGTQPTPVNNEEIFAKLDEILEKRLGGIAKSALTDNGIEGDEAKEIIAAYRAQRQEKANTQTQQLNTLQQENAQLKVQIQQTLIKSALTSVAAEMGIDASKMPYVIKLTDTSDVLDADGNPDTAKLTTALQKVLEDIPALKNDEAGKGFVVVGASGATQQTQPAKPQVATKRWNKFN